MVGCFRVERNGRRPGSCERGGGLRRELPVLHEAQSVEWNGGAQDVIRQADRVLWTADSDWLWLLSGGYGGGTVGRAKLAQNI